MALLRSFVALASLAILSLSSAPIHVSALAADRAYVARQAHAHHDAIVRRKRSDSTSSGLCVPRATTSVPSSSPSSTPTPTTALPNSIPSGASDAKKWCLAWANGNEWLENFAFFSRVKFIYNWYPEYPSNSTGYGLTPMAMLRDPSQVDDFEQKVVQGYANYVLGPNEPNESNQANMSPGQAVDLWMNDINHLKDEGYTLISPACTDDQSGLDWYQEFFSQCQNRGCHVDGIAFHAYTTSAQHLVDYATTLHNTYGLPIYITEFADQNFSNDGNGQPGMDAVWDYAGQVVNFVENTSWVAAACPYGALTPDVLASQNVNTNNGLMDSNGNPTALANFYFN